MPELDDLPAVDAVDVSQDDLLLLFDNSAATSKSRKVTRQDLLKDVAFEDGDHNFGTSEIDDLTATDATIVDLNVTTSLQFDTAATLQKMYRATASIVSAGTAAGASETLTATVTGVATGDFVNLSFVTALPNGLMAQAWISAANTVSVKLYNATSSPIAGATYSAKVAVMRFA